MDALGGSYKEKIDAATEIINFICETLEILQKYTTVSEFLGGSECLFRSMLQFRS